MESEQSVDGTRYMGTRSLRIPVGADSLFKSLLRILDKKDGTRVLQPKEVCRREAAEEVTYR